MIPFTVLSSTFLSSKFNTVHAESLTKDKFVNEGLFGKGVLTRLAEKSTIDEFKAIAEVTNNIIEWFKHLPEHITTFTTTVTSEVYQFVGNLILKTPLFIFNNEWFNNTTYLFSIVAIGLVTILTIFEGFKRKFQKKYVDIVTISKRWFIVAGLSSIVPFLFYHAFKILNLMSDAIIGLNTDIISNPMDETMKIIDILILLAFNLALIVLSVPILLKNARRFFDIMISAVISPIVGVFFIFDSHRHLFNQWWRSLKNNSLVQIVYAFYLLIIGLFIYGAPTPDDTVGIGIKMLIVIGGFMRLINPPVFLSNYLNFGTSLNEFVQNQWSSGINKYKKGIRVISSLKNPMSALSILAKDNKRSVKPINMSTRMGRLHGR